MNNYIVIYPTNSIALSNKMEWTTYTQSAGECKKPMLNHTKRKKHIWNEVQSMCIEFQTGTTNL
jgi:hypothetical protein